MKKQSWSLGQLFFFLFSLFFILFPSCELFNNPTDARFLGNLYDEVAWANAEKLTVTVGFPAEWGSSPQRGTGRCGDVRLGYEFQVEFGAMPGYGFEKWLAFPTSVYDQLNKSLSVSDIENLEPAVVLASNKVKIVPLETVSGSHVASVTIYVTEPVTLVPWCGDRPRIIQSNPPLISSGFNYTRGQQITIRFSMPLNYEDKQEIEFGANTITISGQGTDGTAWNRIGDLEFHNVYFDTPFYDIDMRAIIIKPKEGSEPPELYNITITVGTGIIGANGNGFSAPVSFSYRTSKELVTMAYKASNIWASHDPINDRRVESFFYQTAPSERDRRLRPGTNGSGYTVSLFFNVSRSMGEIVNPEPNALTIALVHYAALDSTVINNELEGKSVNYYIGYVSAPGTHEDPGTFIPMNRNENSAGSIYRQMNNISNPLDVHYYEVVYNFPASIPSGIYRLVLLPYQADGSNERYKDTLEDAIAESRFVTVVIDNDPPNTNGSLFFSRHALILEDGTYCYSTDMRFLTLTPNFTSVSDNGLKGGMLPFQATPNIPWTMDENRNLMWKWNITYRINNVDHEVPGSDWLPIGTAPPPFDLAQFEETNIYNDIGALPGATDYFINVKFKDSLGNENVGWTNMGKIKYTSPPPALPPQNWTAVYNEDTGSAEYGEIIISWTTPISMSSVRIGGNLPDPINPINGIGDSFRRIPNIPKATSGINEYNITLTAYKQTGGEGDASPPVSFKIFNTIGGMTVDANNPAIAVNEDNITSLNTDTALGPGTNANKQWVLTENITLNNWTPIGNAMSNNSFHGKFYGNNQKITISSFNSTTQSFFGFFGHVTDATIRDLTVEYTSVIDTSGSTLKYIGGIAADTYRTTLISNSTVKGSSSSPNIQVNIPDGVDVRLGCIVGQRSNNTQINNCSSAALTITASTNRAGAPLFNYWEIGGVRNDSITTNPFIMSDPTISQRISAVMNLFIINDFADDATAATTPGTLRHAINNLQNGDIISFSGVTPGTSTVYLTNQLRIDQTITVTIEGNGITLTRGSTYPGASNATALLSIGNAVDNNNTYPTVSIRRIHFKDGRSNQGGAIRNHNGTVTLESCIFTGNKTNSNQALGGAILNLGTMTIRGCTFFDNGFLPNVSSADQLHGGAINVGMNNVGYSASLTLSGNLFYGNYTGNADRGHIVHRHNGTVRSEGFNVFDHPALVSNPQSGFAGGTDDATFATVIGSNTNLPFSSIAGADAFTLINSTTLRRRVLSGTNMPAVDFYGNTRTWPGPPGAVTTASPAFINLTLDTRTTVAINSGTRVEVRFTAPSTGTYRFESFNRGTLDPCSYTALTGGSVIDDDSGTDSRNYRFDRILTAGQTFTYWSGVYGTSTANGTYSITVTNNTREIFSEDFEGTNSFTIVNGSATNQWHVGTATSFSGTRSAYISNDNGISNAYTIERPTPDTANSTVHMYRDITFPASTGPYTLTFNVRVQGEGSTYRYDFLRIFLVETTVLPVANNFSGSSDGVNAIQTSLDTVLGTYNLLGPDWTTVNISIPASNAGTAKRLVFTWRNDNSSGSQTPAAVDNIVLWY